MFAFTLATLFPAALIAAGALAGGPWPFAALGAITFVVALGDELSPPTALGPGQDTGAGTTLIASLGVAHFALLALTIGAIADMTGAPMGLPQKLALYFAAGLFFGQVSNSNAHELIHRSGRGLRSLGGWVYISLLFGHHRSAHLLVHHVHVATRDDPASARRGESFYRYMRRAWRGGFRAGARAETDRLARAGLPRWRHPYVIYVGGAAAFLALSFTLAGLLGLLVHLGLAGLAQTQLLMSDYVQHYGLSRAVDATGKPEPVSPRHSWNSPHRLSSALMLNAPRHSDHHIRPRRAYPGLGLEADMPMLPRSLPVMSCLALLPRRWKRVMNPRADAYQPAPRDPL